MTSVIGSRQVVEVTLEKKYSSSRRSCDYKLVGYVLEEVVPSRICVSEKLYDKFPAKGEFYLSGKMTYFGFYIDGVTYKVN